ncbi:hypothetical protein LTR20_005803 [Exophiala xenobiotica]|nr:hypothetical protein LTR92_000042 [Exophiala xenobiotica]KAK5386302.1 hypothetical protein LTS13_001939 [Exophiala xenobiotica]KAK5400296.1 hypothetical protein LTR79_002397 [Exophiala xenobiotica]KAK5414216.1 hypothetical protein LTR90_006856 [Exophiala xenobiotica]KAK5421787.1 hypothetical protein LTR06_000042 [Exophiala xenobiotica]
MRRDDGKGDGVRIIAPGYWTAWVNNPNRGALDSWGPTKDPPTRIVMLSRPQESVNGDITQSNNWDQPVFLTLDDLVLTLEDPAVNGQLRENMGSHTTLAQHQGRQLDISCVRLNVTLRFKKGLNSIGVYRPHFLQVRDLYPRPRTKLIGV